MTVIVLEPAGVEYLTPPPQAMTPLTESASRAVAINIASIPQAPRIKRRRVQNSDNPAKPPNHHGIELCAGELGGLFTTTCNWVVAGGYGFDAVPGSTETCPGEKTQMALTGKEEARH